VKICLFHNLLRCCNNDALFGEHVVLSPSNLAFLFSLFQDGFVEFFQVAEPETTVRNTLMAFAGFAGIGAKLKNLKKLLDGRGDDMGFVTSVAASLEDGSPPKMGRSKSRQRPSSLDLCNGSFKINDGPHQPMLLGVGDTPGLASSKPRAVNRVRDDSEEVEDGSQPCTPDAQCDVDMEDSHTAASLDRDTRQYIESFLADCVSSVKIKGKRDKVQTTMRRVVENVLEKHQYAYNGG